MTNLFDFSASSLCEELITVLTKNEAVRIERIVSTGQTSDWYDQKETEFVALLQGEAVLEWSDEMRTSMMAGDTLIIPANRRHRVCFTSTKPPCIWLCVFWKEDKGK